MNNYRTARYICEPCLLYRMVTQLEMWKLFNLEPLVIVKGVHENDCEMTGHSTFISVAVKSQYELLLQELRDDADYSEMEVE